MILTFVLQMPLIYQEPPAAPAPPNCAPTLSAEPPIPPPARTFDTSVPYGDELGDAWEMEEAACWRGIWSRRGRSNAWDAYWIHPRGERARAKLKIENRDRDVIVIRRHPNGHSCRYDGKVSGDWWEITGTYRCSWEPQTVMAWRAQIIRLEHSEPQLLRTRQSTPKIPPLRPYNLPRYR
jgi:hypothetical protein